MEENRRLNSFELGEEFLLEIGWFKYGYFTGLDCPDSKYGLHGRPYELQCLGILPAFSLNSLLQPLQLP